jgi:tetratricopeptide (TPR) repeat protein
MMKTNTISFKHYQKWDLYESSTDEDEKGEPILPRNDPNFLALEKDLIESQKKREASMKKALNLKDEGNQALKEGKFKKAIRLYSEAIEDFKAMMSLYTNRALAYIKVEDYESALADCEKVIEYLDVFDEELKNNKDLYVKALTRKSVCLQKMKNYSEAKESIEKALSYIKDEEMEKLFQNIKLEEEVHVKALELIKGDIKQFESLDKFIQNIRDNDFESKETHFERVKLILKIDENNKLYFIHKGGLEVVLSHLKQFGSLVDIIELFNLDKKFVLVLNNIKGYNKLIELLFEERSDNSSHKSDLESHEKNAKYITSNQSSLDTSLIKNIVGILEDASQHEEVRKSLSEIKYISELFLTALNKYDISQQEIINDSNCTIILMRFFTLICNIAYTSSGVRTKISSQHMMLLDKINSFSKIFDFGNYLHTNLIESLISFLINLSCEESFRNILKQEKEFLKFIINQNLRKIITFSSNFKKYDELYEKCMSLLYNMNYKDDLNKFYFEEKLEEIIITFLTKVYKGLDMQNHSEISLLRTLMLTVKLVKSEPDKFIVQENKDIFYKTISYMTNLNTLKRNSKLIDNLIKILVYFITKLEPTDLQTEKIIQYISPFDLINSLQDIFIYDCQNMEKQKERVINNMSLLIALIGRAPASSEQMRGKQTIPLIISIAKDKVDLLRKNAAILLAKIAKSSESMQSYVRELHGMDVLLNVAKFIKLEK